MNFTELLGSMVFEHPEYVSESAWHSHIPFAFWCIDVVQPGIFVELGTHNGDSYCAFCQAVHKLGLPTACYAVDTWQGDEHAGFYSEEVYATLQRYHDKRYGAFSRLVRLPFDEAVGYFADSSIDLLHIDGLPTYEAVQHDFKTWLPKLSGRGVVLLHDINVREREFGVWQLWEELCERYPHFSFLHSHGLGVLAVGQKPPPAIERLCSLSDEEIEEVRSIFARLGHTVSVTSERDALVWHAARLESILTERDEALNHLQATLQEYETALVHKDAMLAERGRVLERLQTTLHEHEAVWAQRNDNLTIQRFSLEDKDRLIASYEAERRTFGVQVGRWLSRQRNAWARPTSPQGKILGLMIRAARILHSEGVIPLVRRATRSGLHRVNPQRWPALDWLYTSGLFDTSYYLSTYPDVLALGMEPPKHYIRFGWQEGYNPHPLFDSAFYLAHNPDVAQAGVNPLWHYTTVGWQEGRNPHPLFDSAWYVAHNPDMAQAGVNPLWHYATVGWQEGRNPHPLFDSAWYVAHNPDVAQAGVNPLWHYTTVGWQAGRNPHPLFDSAWYVAHNPDVAQAGVNPLWHYTTVGWQEGYNPHPLFDSAWYVAHNPDVAQAGVNPLWHYTTVGWQAGRNPHPLFDSAWYLAHNPDVAQAGVNPLWHYTTVGWQAGRNPHPLFDSAWYLAHNPDVAQAGVNPLWHYTTVGWQEGRNPHALFDSAFYVAHNPDVVQAGMNPLAHYTTVGWQAGRNPHPLFDSAWYVAHNPDVAQAGVNPLWHYTTVGRQAGRNPHPLFDSAWYLAHNPDVAQAGVNPLWHYTTVGWQEGRNPHALFDSAFYVAHNPDVVQAGMNPLAHYATLGWQAGHNPHPLFDSAFYVAHNPDVAQAGVNPLWHYTTVGWQEGRNPHPLFDSAFYVAHNPDVAQAGVNPLWHYTTVGWQEGRNPHPLFDSAFYLAHNPDVVQAGMNPLAHYASLGWQAGHNPHPLFDSAFYVAHNPDVAQAGVNPLWHYTTVGWQEGRNPHPLFDSAFYVAHNPDVAQAGVNPLWHYTTVGWQAGRNPHPLFDSAFYLAHNPDVAQAGVNPLWHYTTVGWQAGRNPHPLFDSAWYLEGEYEPEMFPSLSEPAVKLIAFYLPQFHPIPENDQWWGKGFTEWTNVSKARPGFPGHYQPHLPGELGFYDLRLVEVMQRQIELAKQYGLYGFCLYLYWFQGKWLLERPVEQFLAHSELDFPFCLCWANENWTRRWDGQDQEILISQEYSPDDDLAFIRDVEPYLRDPRYIQIDGKPLLLVYNPSRLPDAQDTVNRWREYCHSVGIGDLFLVMAQTFGIVDPRPFGFDAAVEFPPHNTHMASRACNITHTIKFFEPGFAGSVYDYADIVRGYPLEPTEYLLFKGAMLGWDNTARLDRRASIFVNSSPQVFQTWLENIMQWTLQHQVPAQRLVFINAWNEWAEGTHLEPDRKYGYAYLNATARALQKATVKARVPKKHTVWIENSSNNSRLPEKIRKLDDKAWLNLLLKSVSTNKIDQVEFPGFPSPELQSTFVGSTNEATLQEAFSFYVLVKKYAEELGNPIRREHRFLDFGCGWGRYLRFFWKDVDENNLYGCDVNQHVLDTCRTLNVPGHFALIDPEGDLPYPDNQFDTIIAYSVFTHLPERVHLHWMRELARVARPGCVFCLTLEPRRFIDFIASIPSDTDTQWYKLIAKFKPQVDEFHCIFDAGEMVFMQTNEEPEAQGTYGDAVIPLSFINREWSSHFTVRAYIDDPQKFWQAVLVVQRL